MRVVLTGATGLIGRQAARALAASGHEVLALSRSGGAVEGAQQARAVDLFERSATRQLLEDVQPEALMHLAWYDGPNRMNAHANLDWAAATLALASDFARSGGRHFLAAGSCAEYDWTKTLPFRETDSLRPASLYGRAKAHTGVLLTEAADALDMDVTWARIFFVYGPGEPKGRLMGDLMHGLRAGKVVPCTDGTQIRDYLHSADVATALVDALSAGGLGCINIGSGQGTQVKDLIDVAADATDSAHLLEFGAIERPANDPASLIADVTKLTAKTGFKPRFGIRDGIADVVARDFGG
ncbi:MAG: NAD-dependent epimerase/dehydratase family protein [Arenibacterium sp.]